MVLSLRGYYIWRLSDIMGTKGLAQYLTEPISLVKSGVFLNVSSLHQAPWSSLRRDNL